jgi:hypothetical protein
MSNDVEFDILECKRRVRKLSSGRARQRSTMGRRDDERIPLVAEVRGEAASDEIVVERFYRDTHDPRRRIDDGIDVIGIRALSLKHCLRLVQALGRAVRFCVTTTAMRPSRVARRLGRVHRR